MNGSTARGIGVIADGDLERSAAKNAGPSPAQAGARFVVPGRWPSCAAGTAPASPPASRVNSRAAAVRAAASTGAASLSHASKTPGDDSTTMPGAAARRSSPALASGPASTQLVLPRASAGRM